MSAALKFSTVEEMVIDGIEREIAFESGPAAKRAAAVRDLVREHGLANVLADLQTGADRAAQTEAPRRPRFSKKLGELAEALAQAIRAGGR